MLEAWPGGVYPKGTVVGRTSASAWGRWHLEAKCHLAAGHWCLWWVKGFVPLVLHPVTFPGMLEGASPVADSAKKEEQSRVWGPLHPVSAARVSSMPGLWVQSAFPAVGRLSKGFPVLSSSPTVLHVLLEQCLNAEYPKVLNSGNLALIYPAVAVMCNGKRMLTRPLS